MLNLIKLDEEYGDSIEYGKYGKYLEDYRELVKSHLNNEYYYLYKLKEMDKGIELSVEEIDDLIMFENKYCQYIDELSGDWRVKYFYQVNPHDKIVIELVNNITEGLTSEKEIKMALKNWIAYNLKYNRDPNWKSDYVFPPSLTVLLGGGDCDDLSVLLASMFMRAGISDVYLLFVDTNQDGDIDHLSVGVLEDGRMVIWEPQYKGMKSAGDEIYDWKIVNAFDVTSFVSNPPPNIDFTVENIEVEGWWVEITLKIMNLGLGDGDVKVDVHTDVYGKEEGWIYTHKEARIHLDSGDEHKVTLSIRLPRNVRTRYHLVVYTYYNGEVWDVYESYNDWFDT